MYTDKFFRFPIKIYDGFSARQAEKSEDMGVHAEAEWYEGKAVLPMSEFTGSGVYWYQSFSVGESPDEVGFTTTTVYSEKFGSFTCTWTMDKFERELNNFMEKWSLSLETT